MSAVAENQVVACNEPWPRVSLFDFCNPKQWPTIPQSAFVASGYVVYGANGKVGYYTEYNHEEPTVLITCRGATCGTVNLCEAKSYVTGNSMALDDLDKSKVSAAYLVYALRNGNLGKAITGSAQPQITRQSLTAISIPLPPLPVQQRIAEILDKAAAVRDKRREALAELDSVAQSIFVNMFGDPIENSHHLPVRPLNELVDPNRPICYGILMPGPDQAAGVSYIRVVDMKDGGVASAGIRRTTQAISNAYRRSLLSAGDLLLSIRGHVGRLATVPAELDGANITQDSARLAIVGAESTYVRECLRNASFQHWMARHTKGVAVRGINLGDVKRMPIPVPPAGDQKRFVDAVHLLERIRKAQAASLQELNALFLSLQHRAFRGEL